MVALLEEVCLDSNTAKCKLLLAVLEQLYDRLKRWEGIDDNCYSLVGEGYNFVKVAAHAFLTAQLVMQSSACMSE